MKTLTVGCGQREPLMVEPDEYCRLAVGRHPLVRCDDHARGLRGLLDPATGIVYAVAEFALLQDEDLAVPRKPR